MCREFSGLKITEYGGFSCSNGWQEISRETFFYLIDHARALNVETFTFRKTGCKVTHYALSAMHLVSFSHSSVCEDSLFFARTNEWCQF